MRCAVRPQSSLLPRRGYSSHAAAVSAKIATCRRARVRTRCVTTREFLRRPLSIHHSIATASRRKRGTPHRGRGLCEPWATQSNRRLRGPCIWRRIRRDGSPSRMPDDGYTEILQVVRSQASQDRVVDLVLRNAASYRPRPRLRSQAAQSMWHLIPSGEHCCAAGIMRPAF
jgi:hypothetical protein